VDHQRHDLMAFTIRATRSAPSLAAPSQAWEEDRSISPRKWESRGARRQRSSVRHGRRRGQERRADDEPAAGSRNRRGVHRRERTAGFSPRGETAGRSSSSGGGAVHARCLAPARRPCMYTRCMWTSHERNARS
jgi:hypothetical protein